MKILLCSPLLSYPGHYTRFTDLRADCIARAGLDVYVLGFPALLKSRAPNSAYTYIGLPELLSARAMACINWLSRHFGKYWLFIGEAFLMQYLALRYASRRGFTALFICDVEPWLFFPAFWMACLRGGPCPKVIGMVTSLFDVKSCMQYMPFYAYIRNRLNKRLVTFLLRYMDIIFDCEYSAQYYELPLGPHIHILLEGHCVDIPRPSKTEARLRIGAPANERMLLLFGMATPGKGADILFQSLKGMYPSFHLYLVGKSGGEHHYSWDGLDDELQRKWSGHLHVVPRYVSEDERVAYFSACDAIVLPYRHGFVSYSGNLRDAIDYGKAILASDQFQIGFMVKKYKLGLTFMPENVDDLRRCLRKFIGKDDAWFQGIAERSKTVVEEYSWDKIGVRYRELFERLVAEDKR